MSEPAPLPPFVQLLSDERTEQWHYLRRQGVTSSDMPAILGINPPTRESAFALWHRKTGGLGQVEPTEQMHWGHRLEGPVSDEFADRHPEMSVLMGGLFAHRDRTWQMATLDRYLMLGHDPAEDRVLEIKTEDDSDGWGDDGTDEVPIYVRAQVMWQLDVMGMAQAHVAALFRHGDYREYVIDYHPADAEYMRGRALDFLQSITDDRQPDLDGSLATRDALHAMYGREPYGRVEIPNRLAREYTAAVARADKAEARLAVLKNQVLAAMGDGRWGYNRGRKIVTRSVFPQRRVDLAAMREEATDLVNRHTHETTVHKLLPARDKTP